MVKHSMVVAVVAVGIGAAQAGNRTLCDIHMVSVLHVLLKVTAAPTNMSKGRLGNKAEIHYEPGHFTENP